MKILCISDTHNHQLPLSLVPHNVDLIIHAGDATSTGQPGQYKTFFTNMLDIMQKRKIPQMIYVSGNHDKSPDWMKMIHQEVDIDNKIKILQHDTFTYNGVVFFGSRYCREFGGWEGELDNDGLKRAWRDIPYDTDILITHTPAFGIMDYVNNWRKDYCGCAELRRKLVNDPPVLHIVGHIHEGFGHQKVDGYDICNVSYCDEHYNPRDNVTVIQFDETLKIVNKVCYMTVNDVHGERSEKQKSDRK